ncbi:MAG: hypothetical protein AB7L92_04675 [Alphaproteobacteria bacterium]
MTPPFAITFEALYTRDGLHRLDVLFQAQLKSADAALYARLIAARADPGVLDDNACEELCDALAPQVDTFMTHLFDAQNENNELATWHKELRTVYACNRKFVQQRAAGTLKPEEARRVNADAILNMLPLVPVDDVHFEPVYAKVVMGWLAQENEHRALVEMAARYASWALHSPAGQERHGTGALFTQPGKLDFIQLVPLPAARISEGA